MKKTVCPSTNSQPKASKLRAAYSLAAGAATAAVGISAAPADAAIHYSGLYNMSLTNGIGPLPLDLDYAPGFGSPDINLNSYSLGGVPYMSASVKYFPGKLVVSNAAFPYYVSALKSGDSIGPSTISATAFSGILASATNANDEFENVKNAFIGLSYPDFGPVYYGWIRVDIDRAAAKFVVKDWAYDDSGAAILAGDTGNGFVPEPGTLGLLAAGSAGLVAMRRRRKAA
jgi:hypothetical protein